MGQIQPIVIKDAAATPADHTFTPQVAQKASEPAVWYERVNGTPLGYNRITALVTTRINAPSKVSIVIAKPELATFAVGCCVDTSTPQVSYTEFANISFSLPAQSSLQNRKDILAFAKNLLANVQITKMVEDLEPAY